MDLAAQDALKFELAALLRGLRRHAAHAGVAEPEGLRALFARLAEDRFHLAVVGRFSRGKTSLMNATGSRAEEDGAPAGAAKGRRRNRA